MYHRLSLIHILHTAMTISIILGLILTAGGILFSRKLLVMMNTPAEILDDAACYPVSYTHLK